MSRPTLRPARVLQLVVITLATWAAAGSAQGIDRARRPDAPLERPFTFPHVRGPNVLANGLRLYVVEDHSVPVVAVRVVTAADSTLDPAGKEGLYAVTLGALLEGTTARSAGQLAAAAADIGTDVRPIGFTTTTALFPRALDLLVDMLVHPKLDSAAIERRKAVQLGAIRRSAQDPVRVPRRLFYSILYGAADPFARSLGASEASITSISVADVAAFYASHFRPDNTSIVITGDISLADALAHVRPAFASWRRGASETAAPSPAATSVDARPTTIYISDVPGPQTYMYVGTVGPSRTSPDAAAADVMGAVATARMQRTLRERRAFMYSGATGFTWRRAARPSAFVGSTVVAAQKVDSALIEWLAILRGLRGSEPISADELAAARNTRVGPLAARIDGADSLASRAVEMVRDTLPLDYFDRYAARASSLTATDLTAAAARVIDMDHLVIVVVGDRKVIEPALRVANLAPVVIVDSSGRPVAP